MEATEGLFEVDDSRHVARVLVETSVPHLDRPFDYEIPAGLTVEVGMRVRVRFAGSWREGWVVETAETSDFSGKLQAVNKVVSPLQLLTPTMYAFAQTVARRGCANTTRIIQSIVPKRSGPAEKDWMRTHESQAAALTPSSGREQVESLQPQAEKAMPEKTMREETRAISSATQLPQGSAWREYPGGAALLNRIRNGQSPNANWVFTAGVFPPGPRGPRSSDSKPADSNRTASKLGIPTPSAPKAETVEPNVTKQAGAAAKNVEHKADKARDTAQQADVAEKGVANAANSQVAPAHPIVELLQAVKESGRNSIVVAPTQREVRMMQELLHGTELSCMVQTAQDSQRVKYTQFLNVRAGNVDVVCGTRSSVYAPLANLGLILVMDAGDDRMTDPQNPYMNALDLAIFRAEHEAVSVVSAGMTMSVAAMRWARAGNAPILSTSPQQRRSESATVEVPDQFDREREGAAGYSQIPPLVQRRVREAISDGPVLIHVPRRGWSSVIACSRCGAGAQCSVCHGPLRAGARADLYCNWCSRPQVNWRCHECKGRAWRTVRLGSSRTAADLGRAFQGIAVRASDADHEIEGQVSGSTLVVATPGKEPLAEDGYAAAVVLDANAVVGRPELWAPEEAMRRWMNVLALVRPTGRMLVVGVDDTRLAQALIRRDPVGYAALLLDEREALEFYPARCIVAVDGPSQAVDEVVAAVELPARCEYLGTAKLTGRDTPKAYGTKPARALLRAHWDGAQELIDVLRAQLVARSTRGASVVNVHVNPAQLF
ncbi:hypothetical protein QS713_06270 [Gleimia hominis]|uniref:Primosomal protein N' 3' DNA-binding domain-containing protein n=2 Tax=Gleimia hominis TaxID=595468 RepID=A0ABU3IBB2_9ACTO|nr:hypothetical protein [Gleimia hominis]